MARLRAALLLLFAALAVGACGDSGDAGADPAAAVPADAPIYVEATVRPDGDLAQDAEAIVRRVLGTDDAGAELRRLFDREAREDGVTYAEDVEPWLGERIGLFFTAFGSEEDDFQGAIVAAASDEDEARDALERFQADEGEATQRTYKDVEYRLVPADDTAFAVTDGFAVVGSESGLRGVVDALEGESLAEFEDFEAAQEHVDGEGLARAYVNPQRFLAAIARAAGGAGGLGAAQLAPLLGGAAEAFTALVTADEDVLRVQTATVGGRDAAGDGGEGAAEAVRALPAAAWAAAGIGDLRAELERGLAQVAGLGGLAGFDLDALLGQIERETGVDVREDLLAWMASAGVFVQGDEPGELGGALVIASRDPAASREAVTRIARLANRLAPGDVRLSPLEAPGVDRGATLRIDGLPFPIAIAATDDRFVVAAGEDALAAALRPRQRLGEDAVFSGLAGELDEVEPTLLVRIGPALALAEALGAGEDETFREVARVLRGFTAVVAGSEREDDVARGRLVVGVR